MKVIANIEHSNFENDFLSSNSFVDITGTDVMTLKVGAKKYYFDVKSTAFTSNKLLLEGIISDDKELLGRCVLNIKIQ